MDGKLWLGLILTALPLALTSGCSGSDEPACLDSAGAALSTACPKSGTLTRGIDVSKWQASINWSQVKGAGYAFGIARASDGLNYPDGYFAANWQGMKQAGLVRGVYQFFRPGQDPIAQADLMLQKLNDAGWIEAGDLGPVLDIEVSDGQSNSVVSQKALQWMQYVEQKTGKTPIVYTSAAWSNVLGSTLSSYPLWVANYTGDPNNTCPLMPDGWQSWVIWQYTSTGPVPGVPGSNVDKNVFDGTLADLMAFAQSGVVAPPNPTGDPCKNAVSGNGPYCGTTLGGDSATLYNCQNGATASSQVCANGCQINPPGTADACRAAGNDPCATASSGNGPYCGKTLGGDQNTLYNCQNSVTAGTTACPYGCVLNPPGTADECAPAPMGSGGSGGTGSGGSGGTGSGSGGSGSGGVSGSAGSGSGSGGSAGTDWPGSGGTGGGDQSMNAGRGC